MLLPRSAAPLAVAVLFIGFFIFTSNAQQPASGAKPPVVAARPVAVQMGPAVDFQREIRPILSDNCFFCHGPDEATRLLDLRLDTREGAFTARSSGTPVVPGDPAASLLYQRITATDKDRVMPPVHSKKTLTDAQRDVIKRWIEQGAPWKEHWAFAAPSRSPLPPVKNIRWVRNVIDRFVLARLEAAGLQPAQEADRRTLARRLSLDLIGLPPQPEAVEAFVNDKSAQAYESYVDRLLESKHWGEHRGRYWLDAARYADTHGVHLDNYREMWPYRDWVINAFNRNLPYDRFIIEQIAGDLIPNQTMDQQIATGFHRCNATTNEDGAIADEVAAIYTKDRVDTTGSVFLGLTMGCASCHDHKFDPISQRDFYSLAAFFRNTKQGPLDGNVWDTPPSIVVPRQEDLDRWNQIPNEEAGLKVRMKAARADGETDFGKWLDGQERVSVRSPLEPADELLALTVEGREPKLLVKGNPVAVTLPEGVTMGDAYIAGRKALLFSGKGFLALPSLDAISADRPFSIAVWFFLPAGEDTFVVASQSDPKSKGRGWSFELARRTPVFRLTGLGGRVLLARGNIIDRLKPAGWYHIAFSYDGNRVPSSLRLFLNGKEASSEGGGEGAQLKGEIRSFSPLQIGAGGGRYFDGGAVDDLRIYNRVLSSEDVSLLARWPALDLARQKKTPELTSEEREGFRDYYFIREHGDVIDLAGQMQALNVEKLAIARRSAVTHVQQEKDGKAYANVLFRGMYDQPKDKVEANTPSVLPPMLSSLPRNRMGLARWLLDPVHPLTSRVTVNRVWQEMFGTGIVKTADDFGSQGEAPSHPELLDWMAVEFRENGWDLKKFYKLMVTSASYRQAAVSTPLKLEKDPENRLLSRGPRFRMDAEMIRDYALAASGLLVPAIGGPSVKPYQPDGVWETVAMFSSNTRFYRPDSGSNLYRRSLYSFWKRSAPPASMDVLNAPTRENCTVRRERTNTPLQALVTMNDVQFVEAARYLAQRALLAAPGDFERQMEFLSMHLVARPLDERERSVTRKAYQDYLRFYGTARDEARTLITQGESPPDSSLPAPELAAMTMVTNQLMNLDEVLVK
ncbi:MAG: DUF1553 domain-containing protein [Acidobacteria bacterium]|nr:DUF1553 domain-containing protein [Acidobacteriota bacterium]